MPSQVKSTETLECHEMPNSDGQESSVQVPSSSVLQLTADGLLSLRNPSGDEVWSPRVPGVAYARMLDTGNFRLVGVDGKAKWESFDFPADTILPTLVLSVGQQDKGWMEHGGGKEKRR
ncbi:putative receptor protein kinase ZmPK1 [Hordeum vulgare]|nr:putative receptor protein kinase ZmPK1 [Hordeum vulgare]